MGLSRGPLGLSWSPLGPFSEPSSGHPRRRWRAPGNPEKDPRGIREGPKSATKPCDESARRTRATNWSDELAPRIRPTKLSDEFLEGRGHCKLPIQTAAPTAKRKLVASGRPSSSSPEQICRPRFSSAVSNLSAKNFVVDFKFVVRQIRRRFNFRRPSDSSAVRSGRRLLIWRAWVPTEWRSPLRFCPGGMARGGCESRYPISTARIAPLVLFACRNLEN